MRTLIVLLLALSSAAFSQIATIPNSDGATFRSNVNANFSWIAQNASAFCQDAGSTDAYACNMNPALTGYTTGAIYRFKAATANTGAATVNFNALGAKTIKKVLGGVTSDLVDNDILVGQWVTLVYDGTNMQMMSQAGNINTPGNITSGSGSTAGGSVTLGNSSGDTAASFVEANSGDAASNAEPAYLKLWSSHATKRQASLFPCTNANGFFCIASATPVADASNIVLTTDNTKTLTNTTLDAEGTGNSITVPALVWLPAAGCNNATASPFWDLPTSTPAVATCVTGTNTQKGALGFADTTGGFSAQNEVLLPDDFTGNIDAKIIWSTGATTGNAKWSLSTICTAVNATETDDAAFNTASTVTTAAPGTANRLQISSITSLTATGCAAGEYLHLKIFRDGNDAADTIAATANLIGVELKIRRAM